MNTQQHIVTAIGWEPTEGRFPTHRVEQTITVTTGEDVYTHKFFASAGHLGMSRSFATREMAIRKLLRDSGHDSISIMTFNAKNIAKAIKQNSDDLNEKRLEGVA
jgi:hypothetical protein